MRHVALHWQILGGMIFGAAIGLALNYTASDRQSELPADKLPAGLSKVAFRDTSNLIEVEITDDQWQRRREAWTAPAYKATRGTLYKYIKNVKSASEGCVTDE